MTGRSIVSIEALPRRRSTRPARVDARMAMPLETEQWC